MRRQPLPCCSPCMRRSAGSRARSSWAASKDRRGRCPRSCRFVLEFLEFARDGLVHRPDPAGLRRNSKGVRRSRTRVRSSNGVSSENSCTASRILFRKSSSDIFVRELPIIAKPGGSRRSYARRYKRGNQLTFRKIAISSEDDECAGGDATLEPQRVLKWIRFGHAFRL